MVSKSKKIAQKQRQARFLNAVNIGDLATVIACHTEGVDINCDENGCYDGDNIPLHIAIIKNYLDILEFLMPLIPYSVGSVGFALQHHCYKAAEMLIIQKRDELWGMKEELLSTHVIPYIQDSEITECINIKNILSYERAGLRQKLELWVKENNFTLTNDDIDKIRLDPSWLYRAFITYSRIYNTPLLAAILLDKDDMAKKLIEWDSSKKSLDMSPNCYMAANTPLLLATKKGKEQLAIDLVLAGADVNKGDNRLFTALHWACILRLNNLIDVLLQYGADPTLENAFGKKALDYYQYQISLEDVEFKQTRAVPLEEMPNSNWIRQPMLYKDAQFKSVDGLFKEVAMHYFATQTPDFSDLFWHIHAIHKNMNIQVPEDISESEIERFEILSANFCQYRQHLPVSGRLAASLANQNSLPSVAIITEGLSAIFSPEKTLQDEAGPSNDMNTETQLRSNKYAGPL